MSKVTDHANINSITGISEIHAASAHVMEPHVDENARRQLIDAAERLIIAARTPGENLYLTSAQPPFLNGAIGAAYRIGCFDSIPEDSGDGISAEEVAWKTGADKPLVVRLLRVLSSAHIFKETGPEMYAHSHLSRILSTGPNRALFYMHNTILGPGAMSLNQYLESHGFSNPTDHHNTPFQYGHKTTLDLWAYLQEKPARSKIFNEHMRSSAIVGSSALPPFPFSTELKCDSDEEVLLVDIGGGKGQALQSILNAYPNMKGRMIVQDLREVIQDAESSAHLPPSIETMASDFFKPQPVKGAKAYFMRRIMHDWGDKECKLILENIISSMTEDSKLLINDLVLPQEGCHRRMALNDIAMMIFGGLERTESQWETLLGEVGLQIMKIWSKEGENLSVIETVMRV